MLALFKLKNRIHRGNTVTIVDNETNEKWTGKLLEYTPHRITIQTVKSFDAKKYHFKRDDI